MYCVQLCRRANNEKGYTFIIARLCYNDMTVLIADSLTSAVKEIDLKGLTNSTTIQLEKSGHRWEGGALHGKPFGYGCLYGNQQIKVYEGFMYEGRRVCYGIEFNEDEKENYPVYCGTLLNGRRFSRGCTYSANGSLVHAGEFVDGQPTTSSGLDKHYHFVEEPLSLSMKTFVLKIGKNTRNQVSQLLRISPLFTNLKVIDIGLYNLNRVKTCYIEHLENLEEITFGRGCFADGSPSMVLSEQIMGQSRGNIGLAWDSLMRGEYTLDDDSQKELNRITSGEHTEPYILRISHCPKLRRLFFPMDSFFSYDIFEIADLPCLQSVEVLESCFSNVKNLVVQGMLEPF